MQKVLVTCALAALLVGGCASTSAVDELEERVVELDKELAQATALIQRGEAALKEALESIDAAAENGASEVELATREGVAEIKATANASAGELAAAAGAVSDTSREVRDLREDLDATQVELYRTRLWVGDLAHCLIYEADLGRYTYLEATTLDSAIRVVNRGEWDSPFGAAGEPQMSHCER